MGMVSMMVSSSVRRACRACVEVGELGGGALGGGVGAFEVGGHDVEAVDEFAELFGGGLADAVGVVAGGDGFHGVGEGFDWAGDLLAEIEGEPAAGEEGERGGEEKEAGVEVADFAALAVEGPVPVGGFAKAERGGGDSGGDGEADDDEVAVAKAGGGEGVVGAGEGVEGLVGALGGLEDGLFGAEPVSGCGRWRAGRWSALSSVDGV